MSKEAIFPIFSMVNDFESKSFHIPEIKAQHRSLYYFLLGVLLHRKGANRFNLALDYGMSGSKIGNHRTYIATLQDLEKNKFLTYTPGKNRFTFPIIELHFCKPTASLLHTYCKSIGISTASNIKAGNTENAEDTEDALSSGSEEPKQQHKFLILFNELTGRKFRGPISDKTLKQLDKLKKKGFKLEDFKTAIINGNRSSAGWDDPSNFTPEYISREDKFLHFLNAGTQAKPTAPTKQDLQEIVRNKQMVY